MLKYLSILLCFGLAAQAQENTSFQTILKETVSLEMCHDVDHMYNEATNTCFYCAQGTAYNPATQECEGKLSPIGKCFGDDHYHAATKECMYCATGYAFDEGLRKCMPKDAQ